jgi:hypothetical protein
MQVNLSNEDIKTIVSALVSRPWLEVNDLMTKLTGPQIGHIDLLTGTTDSQIAHSQSLELLTLPVVNLPQTDAPYGLRKDGTPAKRRGRRPAVKKTARKARQ